MQNPRLNLYLSIEAYLTTYFEKSPQISPGIQTEHTQM